MAFIPVNDCAMVELRYTFLGQQMENTLYFDFAGSSSPDVLLDIGSMVLDWWTEHLSPAQSVSLQLTEVFVTDLTSAVSPALSTPAPDGSTGGKIGDPEPGNVSLAVSFKTGGRGRSSRGRNYFVGFVETQVTGNRVQHTDATDIQAAYQALIGIASAASTPWVVVSRFLDGAPRVTGLKQDVTSVSLADENVDSMRRRLNGRGS